MDSSAKSRTIPINSNFDCMLRKTMSMSSTACLLVLLTLQALTASGVAATAQTCPPRFSDPRLQADDATDVNAPREYRAAIAEMLATENFVNLDCLADRVRTSKARFAGGMWKLHTVYEGLESPLMHPTEKDWNDHLNRIQRWIQANPESITARVALGESYLNYAWDARGEEAADSVSENGWELFAERAGQARKTLEEASSLKTKCPEWYLAMMSVAVAEGWEPEPTRQLLERGFSMEPEYYYLYREYSMYLLPKWYGEEGQAEAFENEIADRLGAERGDATYFQIAAFMTCNCVEQPQLKHMSWPRIQNGFSQLDKQYGTSLTNLNYLAHMAIKLNDAIVAEHMFKRIGDQWSAETWHNQDYFDSSKKWAAQMAPMAERQRSVEAEADANRKAAGGLSYQTAFEQKFANYMGQCVADPSVDREPFAMFVQVGEGGTVKQLMTLTSTAVSQCLFQNLMMAQMRGVPAFPAPPRAPYWIRLNLDPASIASDPKLAGQ
jgi:hypothetical protein